MSNGNQSDAELFPTLNSDFDLHVKGLVSNSTNSPTSRRYAGIVLEALDEIEERKKAEIAEREARKERGDYVPRDVDHGPLYDDLRQVWCTAEKQLSEEILDETADGFPELWVWNGGVITTTKTWENDGKSSVVGNIPLAIDYFGYAKASLKEAATIDVIESPFGTGKYPSALFAATSYLYSALKFKAMLRNFRPVTVSAGLMATGVLVAALLGIHFIEGLLPKDSLLAALLVIVQFVGALLTVATAYGMFSSARDDAWRADHYKREDASIAQKIGKHYANAEKLLHYYRLWREDVAKRVEQGYKIRGIDDKDMLPGCLEDMDAVISELERLLSRASSIR